jgi:hypothetical protein
MEVAIMTAKNNDNDGFLLFGEPISRERFTKVPENLAKRAIQQIRRYFRPLFAE